MRSLLAALAVALPLICAPGCGSDETTTKPPTDEPVDSGDGRFHPPPSGARTAEMTACDALSKAQDNKVQALKCSITTRTCPSLLRVEFGVACLEYDEGSVQGCIEYYAKQASCSGLEEAIKDCVITSYPGTEPEGCPTSSP